MRYLVPYYMGNRVHGLNMPGPYELISLDLTEETEMTRMAELAPFVVDAIDADALPVVYAGDCCIIIPVVSALQQRGLDPVVVFYDAHGDFNTWDTTESGFIGGMPLAMITGRGEMTIAEACGMRTVPDEDAFLVDGRDLDRDEAVLLADSGVHQVDNADIAEAVPADRPLYVHVDVDVVDPIDMPAVNDLAPGGPGAEDVAGSVKALAETGRVVAFSVSAWNPALEGADQSEAATNRIAAPFL